jgi:hypothetical protein
MHIDIHAWSGIRTHDHSVRASEEVHALDDQVLVDYRIVKLNSQVNLCVVATRLQHYFCKFIFSRIDHSFS